MVSREPHAPGRSELECRNCPYTVTAISHPPTCPRCGGYMRTLPHQS